MTIADLDKQEWVDLIKNENETTLIVYFFKLLLLMIFQETNFMVSAFSKSLRKLEKRGGRTYWKSLYRIKMMWKI